MALQLACGCGKQLKAPDEAMGRKAICAGCGRVHQIPIRPGSGVPKLREITPAALDRQCRTLTLDLQVLPKGPLLLTSFNKLRTLGDEIAVQCTVQAMAQWGQQQQLSDRRKRSSLPDVRSEELNFYGIEHLGDMLLTLPSCPLEPLFHAVQSDDSIKRQCAAHVLGRQGSPSSVDALVWAIQHPLHEYREDRTSENEETGERNIIDVDAVDYLYGALVAMGTVAVDKLLPMLRIDDPRCPIAVEALGQIKDARAIPGLVNVLLNAIPPLAISALEALDRLRWSPNDQSEVSARQFAIACNELRWRDIHGLGSAAVARAVKYLLKRLDESGLDECFVNSQLDKRQRLNWNPLPRPAHHHWHAVIGLGELKAEAAAEKLLALCSNADSNLRFQICVALANIGDVRSLDIVPQLEIEHDFQRREILTALENVKDRRAADQFISTRFGEQGSHD